MTCGGTKTKKKKQKYCMAPKKLRNDDEIAWAPVNKSDWLDWEEARNMEKSASRLELEGEAEVPEIITMSDAVESTKVDLDGRKPPRTGRRKIFEKEKYWAKEVRR